jgi:hypothetical protein
MTITLVIAGLCLSRPDLFNLSILYSNARQKAGIFSKHTDNYKLVKSKKAMKILICLIIVTSFLSFSCAGTNKQLKKGKKSANENVTSKNEEKRLSEPEVEIKEVEEKLVKIDEKLPDPHRYFVIIGSFRNSENAKKYQKQILKNGFSSEILKNEAGLYRVSVMATDEIETARDDVRRIRRTFPEYSDTWLLIQKR